MYDDDFCARLPLQCYSHRHVDGASHGNGDGGEEEEGKHDQVRVRGQPEPEKKTPPFPASGPFPHWRLQICAFKVSLSGKR